MLSPVTPEHASSCVWEGTTLRMPALIDCHVHFREPGLEHKGDMQSESEAAYYGGISAVCEMPNTNPPTQSIAALADKVARSAKARRCRMFFFFGATALSHLAELEALWTQSQYAELKAHCCGLKLYLDNSTGDLKCQESVTEAAFELCGRLRIPLVAHCEQSAMNDAAAAAHNYTNAASHSLRRPASAEVASIQEAIERAQKYRTPLHIAHLSTAGGLDAIRSARQEDPSLRLTCEVAPHHLFLTTEDYTCCGAKVKVNPPIRPATHHEALWEGVLDGTVDCIATDHAPHTLAEKENAHGQQPPSGMPGVELVVPLLLTVAAGRWPHPTAPRPRALHTTMLTIAHIVRLLHRNPNVIFNLNLPETPLRGFDLSAEWTVKGSELHSKCHWTPYEGWVLLGKALVDDEEGDSAPIALTA